LKSRIDRLTERLSRALDAARRPERLREFLPDALAALREPKTLRALPLLQEGRKLSRRSRPLGEEKYREAIRLAPGYFRAHSFLAMLLHNEKRFEEALAEWNLAVELAPGSYSSRLGLGRTLLAVGQKDRAREVWERLVEARPDRSEAFTELAALAHGRGDLEAAARYLQRAYQLLPDDFVLTRKYAAAIATAGDERALEILRPRLGSGPTSAEMLGAMTDVERVVHPYLMSLPWWAKELGWPERLRPACLATAARREPRPLPGGRPLRILFASHRNWSFMQGIVEGFASSPAHEVRTLELEDYVVTGINLLSANEPQEHYRRFVEEHPVDAKLIDEADVVFCEWCTDSAVWLSRCLPPEKRLVIRLHSSEAYGPWPVLVDWGRVDALIFVADHVRDHVVGTLGLEGFSNLLISVVPQGFDCSRFEREKHPGAEQTLGLIGYSDMNKDPKLAIEILKLLVEKDDRWRLRLVGAPFDPSSGHLVRRAYALSFPAFVEASGLSDRISFDPWTHDIAGWLQDVGFILSTSEREGTHEAVAEGMASGAVPVVRNWPAVASLAGAARRYPNALLFETAAEAAEKIANAGSGLGVAARREAKQRFDLEVLFPRLEAVIRGEK
jgi:tetratricopeptide (TPR) repeat protein